MPRPNRTPWPPTRPTIRRTSSPWPLRSLRSSSATSWSSVRSASTSRPFLIASTPSSVLESPSAASTAAVVVPGPTRYRRVWLEVGGDGAAERVEVGTLGWSASPTSSAVQAGGGPERGLRRRGCSRPGPRVPRARRRRRCRHRAGAPRRRGGGTSRRRVPPPPGSGRIRPSASSRPPGSRPSAARRRSRRRCRGRCRRRRRTAAARRPTSRIAAAAIRVSAAVVGRSTAMPVGVTANPAPSASSAPIAPGAARTSIVPAAVASPRSARSARAGACGTAPRARARATRIRTVTALQCDGAADSRDRVHDDPEPRPAAATAWHWVSLDG